MLSLLNSDLYKLVKSRTFWICLIACIVIGSLMVFGMNAAVAGAADGVAGDGLFEGMAVEEMNAIATGVGALAPFISMGFHIIIIAVFVSIFVSGEFQYGTIKNTLSRGCGRVNVFFSKFFATSIAGIVMMLALMLGIVGMGSIMWGYDPLGMSTLTGMLTLISLQGLTVIAYAALFTFTSMSLRGMGGAIAVNVLVVFMLPTILNAVSMMLGGGIALNDFWLGWNVDYLTSFTPYTSDMIRGITLALAWGIPSIAAGTILFKRVDVK